MATKEELEIETAELKSQLAELLAAKPEPVPDIPIDEVEPTAELEGGSPEDEPQDGLQTLIEQATGVIDDHPSVKPLLLLMGVFGIGFLLGRSR